MIRKTNTATDKEDPSSTAAAAADTDKDEESQSPLLGVTAPPGGVPVPASSPHYNKAIIILRKIISVGIVDDGNGNGGGGVVALLQDVIVGVILAVLTISVIMWLDFVGIVHFESAHALRNSAFEMVNDPETLANLEESTGLKFMKMEEFNAIDEQINKYAEMLAKKQGVIDEKTKLLEETKKEIDPLREELKKFESELGLDKFCGACKWKGRDNCNVRLGYAMAKYNQTPAQVKLAIMVNDLQCISA